jgi:small subunit ribosomal protein S15
MALSTNETKEIVQKFRRSELDTGSPEVQVALMTTRILQLTKHFETAKKDQHGRRGMFRLISQRRTLLNYLRKTKPEVYTNLISTLKLRK